MITIEPYKTKNLAAITRFVEAIQEHERSKVPELKPGAEIGKQYIEMLLKNVDEMNGIMLIAKSDGQAIGFVCTYIDEDDDLLLRDEFHSHAYISDIYVEPDWRGQGIAAKLLEAVENEMSARGCKQIRICSKATNLISLKCYDKAGYERYEVIFRKTIA
jgi:ribosomal protein S18 acetylase RimI-like enzyme